VLCWRETKGGIEVALVHRAKYNDWGFAKGKQDPGELLPETAVREVLEETGLKAAHWEELLRMHLSNSVSDELAIIFLATDLSYHEPEPEDTEQLQRKKVSLEEAWRMVQAGSITDAISVAAIQAMLLRKLKA
jgi:8-oxo-dGTP pyrophosphatase MutT (NUDIX family)